MSAEGRDRLYLLLFTALLVGAGLGLRDPWPADEPRFALVARDMVATGDWLFPRVGGDLYPDKPPFYFWVIASFYLITGSLRLAFLLPALVAALGVVALVHDMARRLFGRSAALLAAGTLAASVQFVAVMRGAQIDPFLCLLTTFSLYALLRHLLLGPDWRWYFAGALVAGLGVITKGVGFLPILVLLPFALLRARGFNALPPIRGGWRWPVLGLGGLLLGIAVWLVPMVLAVAASGDPALQAYRDEILFQQTVTRYSAAWHHVEPWYYFFVNVIPGLWLPFSLLLLWLVPRWREAWRERNARVWLPLGWLLVLLLFFSLSSGKRGVYVFPGLPALALAAAPFLPALYAKRAVRIASLLLAAVLVLITWALAIGWQLNLADLRATAAGYGVTHPWPLYLLAAATLLAWLICSGRAPLLGWPATLLSCALVWALALMPQFNGERSSRDFMAGVIRLAGAQPLGLAAWKEQFLLYVPGKVTHFGHNRWQEGAQEFYDAARWLNETPEARLLVPAGSVAECFAMSPAQSAGRSSGSEWVLIAAPAASACAERGQQRRFIYGPG